MTLPPRFSCVCGRPDFEAEQASVYSRYGWELANYFALLDKFTWEDDFHDMMPRSELQRFKAGYSRLGDLLADRLPVAIERCALGARTGVRLETWVAGLGLHFGADVTRWRSYRAGTRRMFRLLPLSASGSRWTEEAPSNYGRSWSPIAPQN